MMTVAHDVGRNIRRSREQAGLSLADLATAAGVGKSTLHAIEQGDANPTLSTLWSLATALRVPLGSLLDQPAPRVRVVRGGEGPRVDGEAVHARLMHRVDVRGTIEVYDIAVDVEDQRSEPHLPGVAECLVVTEGGVRTGPEGGEVELGPGDSIYFDADRPHGYRGAGRAVLIMIYT